MAQERRSAIYSILLPLLLTKDFDLHGQNVFFGRGFQGIRWIWYLNMSWTWLRLISLLFCNSAVSQRSLICLARLAAGFKSKNPQNRLCPVLQSIEQCDNLAEVFHGSYTFNSQQGIDSNSSMFKKILSLNLLILLNQLYKIVCRSTTKRRPNTCAKYCICRSWPHFYCEYLGVANIFKWGIPERTIQNAVQRQ